MAEWEKALDAFKKNQNLWDSDFDLPTVPMHNNPWIYCAYAFKILRSLGLPDAHWLPFRTKIKARLAACKLSPGYYHRYPGGRGGLMSHDEILGIAWLDQDTAREIYFTLIMNDGIYANEPLLVDETANVFRIFWVKYAIQGLSGVRLSLISQALFGAFLVIDALKYNKEGDGSRLRFWLVEDMLDRIPSAWLLGLCFLFWQKKMEGKGVNPKQIFSKKYLKELPEFGAFAPDTL